MRDSFTEQSSPLLAQRVRVAIAEVFRQYGVDVDLNGLSEDLTTAIYRVLSDSTREAPEMLLVTLSFMYSTLVYSLCGLGERNSEAPIRLERERASSVSEASSVGETKGMTGSKSDIPIEVQRLIKGLLLRKQQNALAPLLAERLRPAIADVLREHGVDILLSGDLTDSIHRVLVDYTDEAPELFLLTLRFLDSSLGYGKFILDKRLTELELADEDRGSAC